VFQVSELHATAWIEVFAFPTWECRLITSRIFFQTFPKTRPDRFLIDSGATRSRTIIDKTTTRVRSPCPGCEIKAQSSADLGLWVCATICPETIWSRPWNNDRRITRKQYRVRPSYSGNFISVWLSIKRSWLLISISTLGNYQEPLGLDAGSILGKLDLRSLRSVLRKHSNYQKVTLLVHWICPFTIKFAFGRSLLWVSSNRASLIILGKDFGEGALTVEAMEITSKARSI